MWLEFTIFKEIFKTILKILYLPMIYSNSHLTRADIVDPICSLNLKLYIWLEIFILSCFFFYSLNFHIPHSITSSVIFFFLYFIKIV